MKVIYNAISKTLLYHCKCPEKPRVLVLNPIGKSAKRVGGTTIHFGLRFNPGSKLLGLNDKYKVALKNMLSEVKLIIIDELSMILNDLWTDIDSRLGDIFMMNPEKVFADLTVITAADLLQLPLIRAKLIFSHFCGKDSIKHLLDLQLWYLFKYAESI